MVVLHLDEATDARALLGCYVVGAGAGDFRWQPGALARALSDGRWLLLEAVDAAPPELLATLRPLIDGRQPLPVPGRSGVVSPRPGFALFATRTLNPLAPSRRDMPSLGLWARVGIAPPPPQEAADILRGLYPAQAALVGPMLACVDAARGLAPHPPPPADAPPSSAAPSSAPSSTAHSSGVLKDAGLRDALKWSRRVSVLHSSQLGAGEGGAPLSERLRTLAASEGGDVLCGRAPPSPARSALLARIAAAWGVAPPCDSSGGDKPAVVRDVARRALTVGRARVDIAPPASPSPSSSTDSGWAAPGFCLTASACRLLEQLSACVACSEPALLVGETGCGKTAAVQALASAAGRRLIVVNMSTQSESGDLLGGFRPVNAATLAAPLAAAFAKLFGDTFPRERNAEFAARVVRVCGVCCPPPPTRSHFCPFFFPFFPLRAFRSRPPRRSPRRRRVLPGRTPERRLY